VRHLFDLLAQYLHGLQGFPGHISPLPFCGVDIIDLRLQRIYALNALSSLFIDHLYGLLVQAGVFLPLALLDLLKIDNLLLLVSELALQGVMYFVQSLVVLAILPVQFVTKLFVEFFQPVLILNRLIKQASPDALKSHIGCLIPSHNLIISGSLAPAQPIPHNVESFPGHVPFEGLDIIVVAAVDRISKQNNPM
jgi:hypothetical protein